MLTITPNGVRVWDIGPDSRTATEIFILSASTPYEITRAIWSPDGDRILTIHQDGKVRQYYTQMADWLEAACQRAPRNLTHAEWTQYLGDEPYRATYPNLPIPTD